jgi:hypothetical protein
MFFQLIVKYKLNLLISYFQIPLFILLFIVIFAIYFMNYEGEITLSVFILISRGTHHRA